MQTENGIMQRQRFRRGIAPFVLAGVGAMTLAACDLGVFDPGTIEHDDLFEPEAIQPLVIGAERNFGRAISSGTSPHGGIFGAGAYLTDEIVHSGQWIGMVEWSNAAGIDNSVAETSGRWSEGQNARGTAQNAATIIREVVSSMGEDPNASAPLATALMWEGFSTRVLSDAFCNIVLDGGPLEPVSAGYARAEQLFGEVIVIGGAAGDADLVTAGHAGRAQVRMMLGDWSGATADAAQVPTGFVQEVRMSSNSTDETNGLNVMFRGHDQASIWGTPFAQYGTDLSGVVETDGDPRVSYWSRDDDGDVRIGGDGRREYWVVSKYETRDTNIPAAKGTEMRLIEAEAALIGSDVVGALVGINAVRTHRNLDPVVAVDINEVWYLLQRERGIELYAEGRRLPDVRRWASVPGFANFSVVRTPAAPQPPEQDEVRNVLNNPSMPGGDLCLPVSQDEINSNPNI
jgi:starch-binding outer membrane protein, SusD/RagB family